MAYLAGERILSACDTAGFHERAATASGGKGRRNTSQHDGDINRQLGKTRTGKTGRLRLMTQSKLRAATTDGMSLAERVKLAREQAGLSQAELAIEASTIARRRISQQSIADIESGHVKQSRVLDEIAAALKTTGQYLKWGELGVTLGRPAVAALPDDLPIFPCVIEPSDGDFMRVEFVPHAFASRPRQLRKSRKAFAAHVASDDMSPAYETGDLLLLDPRGKPSLGRDYLFVSCLGRPARCILRRLIKATRLHWEVAQFKPSKHSRLAKKDFPHALVVVGVYRAQ